MYLTEIFGAYTPIKRYLLAYVFPPFKVVCVFWILIGLQDCLRLLWLANSIFSYSALRDGDVDGNEKVTEEVNSSWFKLYRAYSISFNSSDVGIFFWGWILKVDIEVQKKK